MAYIIRTELNLRKKANKHKNIIYYTELNIRKTSKQTNTGIESIIRN